MLHTTPIPPCRPHSIGPDDVDAYGEGWTSALQGRGLNPYPRGTRDHEVWNAGFKDGARLPTILWHGTLDPYGENPYAPDGRDADCHVWYDRGQKLALAVGQEQLDAILGRLPA